jgi:LemA protein
LAANTVAEEGQANNQITQALGRLFAVAEAYPDLKANQNFLELQEELTATEDRIGYARQFYNDAVLKYDNKRQSFPTVIVAKFGNFPEREYFEIEEPAAREVPRVQF